jgi:hypothetical protein
VALLTTILTVVAMLGGISLLLWLSTVIEDRHLGPPELDGSAAVESRVKPKPALSMVDSAVDSARAGLAAGVKTAA